MQYSASFERSHLAMGMTSILHSITLDLKVLLQIKQCLVLMSLYLIISYLPWAQNIVKELFQFEKHPMDMSLFVLRCRLNQSFSFGTIRVPKQILGYPNYHLMALTS